jgi:3-phosphoshikimate 1-carboxyvinyltransferase
MPDLLIRFSGPLRGAITVPGDKSITHRALMLASIAEGDTIVEGWVPAEVCLATMRCVQALGAQMEEDAVTNRPSFSEKSGLSPAGGKASGVRSGLRIAGKGLRGLTEPADVLHCAGSGTTIRLLAGLLAGQPFTSILTGTEPLRRRPMGRVAEPLRLMGATVLGRDGGRLPPLTILGGNLKGIDYTLPVASAQVKSAILLAALFAEGETVIHEPGPSRDHTERMLRWFSIEVDSDGPDVRLCGGQTLRARAQPLVIPGDFSSAAFPLVAASIVRRSNVSLRNVGLNPTRTGLLDLLLQMGGLAAQAYDLGSPDEEGEEEGAAVGEPVGELAVRSSELHGVEVGGDLVVRAIDEFPIFAVLATQAEGTTTVRDATELRVKESDRIATVAAELRKMGASIEERPDGMVVHGPTKLRGAQVECHRDHRLAMALAIAGLVADGSTTVAKAEAIDDSFPGFVEAMRQLGADIKWQQ